MRAPVLKQQPAHADASRSATSRQPDAAHPSGSPELALSRALGNQVYGRLQARLVVGRPNEGVIRPGRSLSSPPERSVFAAPRARDENEERPARAAVGQLADSTGRGWRVDPASRGRPDASWRVDSTIIDTLEPFTGPLPVDLRLRTSLKWAHRS